MQSPMKYTIYADDITIFLAGKNIEISQIITQNTLNELQKFACKSGFKYSKTKTTVTAFSRKHENETINLYLDKHKLTVTNNIKILGLHFNRKHTWATHIKQLKIKSNHRLNILKSIAPKNWGADQSVLYRTYKAILQPTLDYGSIVYDAASKNLLKSLDPILHLGARIITGAFRTSPTIYILAEAHLIPLNHRSKKLCINYYLSLKATPSNHVSKLLQTKNLQFTNKNAPKLLYIRINEYINELELEIPELIPRTLQENPPWIKKYPEFTTINNTHQSENDSLPHTTIKRAKNHIDKAILIFWNNEWSANTQNRVCPSTRVDVFCSALLSSSIPRVPDSWSVHWTVG